jgi:hypothetical protein
MMKFIVASVASRHVTEAVLRVRALDRRQDLSGIENILRIERLLQNAHGVDRLGAEFGLQVVLLALRDAVLSGAGPAYRRAFRDRGDDHACFRILSDAEFYRDLPTSGRLTCFG